MKIDVMTTQAMQVLEIPLTIYDAASGRNSSLTLYFDANKSEPGTWYQKMLEAQSRGEMLPTSGGSPPGS